MITDTTYIHVPAGTVFDTDSEIDTLINEAVDGCYHPTGELFVQPFITDTFAINSIAWFRND